MIARLLIGVIILYQRTISPYMNCCLFFETCSHFGIQVLKKYGAIYGSYFIILRLLACQSWIKVPWFDDVASSDIGFKKCNVVGFSVFVSKKREEEDV